MSEEESILDKEIARFETLGMSDFKLEKIDGALKLTFHCPCCGEFTSTEVEGCVKIKDVRRLIGGMLPSWPGTKCDLEEVCKECVDAYKIWAASPSFMGDLENDETG